MVGKSWLRQKKKEKWDVCVKRNFAAMCEGDRIEAEERKRNDKTRKLRGKNQGEKEEEETYRTSFIIRLSCLV